VSVASPYDTRVRALLEQWDLLVPAVQAADPGAPSRAAGWTVADLERHLSLTTSSLADYALGPEASGTPVGVAGWAASLPGLAEVVDEAARTATAPSLAEAAARAREALDSRAGGDGAKLVQQRTGVHTLADAVLFRLVEGVVHGLDLPEPLTPARPAAKLVVQALAALLAERAPGRSVEVRVPPYAAVQCVAGPRHTRGTPPNTVETDPVTFLLLATGRLAWGDASARVRATGERAGSVGDLLPLLA
jgi:uncharacterized protein (TIGR03083 family)